MVVNILIFFLARCLPEIILKCPASGSFFLLFRDKIIFFFSYFFPYNFQQLIVMYSMKFLWQTMCIISDVKAWGRYFLSLQVSMLCFK